MPREDIQIECATKALHSAQFLVRDLQELLKHADPLLADTVLQELPKAVALETRLKQLSSILEERIETATV